MGIIQINQIDNYTICIDNIYMTIQQLEYVQAVIKHGSFSKAAEACFVTQPTLSSQISKLERELGLYLLDRMRRPVGPAPGTGEILERARSAIQQLKTIPILAAEYHESVAGELRIGIIPTLSQYLLPLFLDRYLEAYPDVKVKISELKSDDILNSVLNSELDCGILALPTGAEGLMEHPLFYEEFYVYFGPGDQEKGRININDLSRDELLLLTDGHCLRDQVVDLCGPPSTRRNHRVEFETGSLESLKCLVEQGMGYTLLPELSLSEISGDKRCRVHPLGPVPPVRRIGMVSHPAFLRPKLHTSFSDAILDGLPEAIRNKKVNSFLPWRG